MTIVRMPEAHLSVVWPDFWPLLETAYLRSKEKQDLLGGLFSHNLQLFAIYDKLVPVAGIVTRLNRVTTSGDLHCRIWLVGGSRLSEWAPDFIAKLIPWAKAEGCSCIDGAGRKGWARIVARFGGVRVEDEAEGPCWRLAL